MGENIKFKATYFSILLTLCGCSNSTAPITSPSLQQINNSSDKKPSPNISISQNKKITNASAETSESHPDTFRSGSDVPSKWVYSRDGMVGCRVNKWFGYGGTEQGAKFEFINVKSKQPVNIVYRVNSIGVKGKVYRLLNPGSDNQVEYTRFTPPMKKGESKIEELSSKYPSYHSTKAINLLKLEIKDCRIKKDGENETTLKPEQARYYKENPGV